MGLPEANLPPDFTREEFDKFLHAYTHAIRNRLNGIALEAADLAEQAGGVDSMRLQQQIQECSLLLRAVREMLVPDEGAPKMPLAEATKRLREKNSL